MVRWLMPDSIHGERGALALKFTHNF
jgi:hypothetical protein